MPTTVHSPLPFVGREKELAQFQSMLDGAGPWLMWVTGPGGQGKSWLLEAMLRECDSRDDVVTGGLIDFFTDGLRTHQGILEEVAGRFGVTTDEFKDARQGYQEAYQRREGQAQAFHLGRMEKEVVRALRELQTGERRLVLAFDTIELVSRLGVGQYFFGEFLPQLKPGLVVVAAGRELPEQAAEMLAGESVHVDLTREDNALSLEAVVDYLRQMVPGFDQLGDNAFLEHLHAITAGKGQALMVALVADVLSGRNYATQVDREEDLVATLNRMDAKGLREWLVDGPLSDEVSLGTWLLKLAHLYHGIDANQLAHLNLARPRIIPGPDVVFLQLVKDLRELPYVKFHGEEDGPDVIRLHDYFADRARENAWKYQDPDFSARQALSRAMVTYFEEQIAQEPLGVSPRLDSLREQWLYHLFFANRERAYGELWEMLDQAWHHLRFDFMDVLLERASMINTIFATMDHPDPVLESLGKAARAWMDLETARGDEAESLADELLADHSGVRRLRLTALVAKGTMLGRNGHVDEGVARLNEAFDGYEELLIIATAAEAGDAAAIADLRSEHGLATIKGIRPERYLVLNTIGYQERNRGKFKEARAAYERSYRLSRNEGDPEWQASAATRIGDVVRYMGEIPRAFDWVKKALAVIHNNDLKEEEGFTLIALGRLQRDRRLLVEAEESFQKARAIWEPLAAQRYLAETELELGWVDVLLGEYAASKEHFKAAEWPIVNRYQQLVPSLREKQGRGLLKEAQDTEGASLRDLLLRQAEQVLLDGVEVGQKKERTLYVALCLVALCRVAEMRGEYERMAVWEEQLRGYASKHYHFGPAYADLEQVLGDAVLQQASVGQPDFNLELFDDATDHYLQIYIHLAREAPFLYRERRDFLREWLPSLPDNLRLRAGRRMIDRWRQEGDLATEHPGIIQTIQIECDIEPE